MSSLTSSRTRVAALLLVVFLLLLIFGGNGGSGFYSTKGLEEVFNSTLGVSV
jgi:uncharacterized membrane protein YphA (DoxX/SURF4 family)